MVDEGPDVVSIHIDASAVFCWSMAFEFGRTSISCRE